MLPVDFQNVLGTKYEFGEVDEAMFHGDERPS
jgi:hypothetical protein